MVSYMALREQLKGAGVKEWQPQPEEISNGDLNGWLALRAPNVALRNWYAMPTMRNVEPTARFGNLLLYHGDFLLPRVTAGILRFRAIHMLDEAGSDSETLGVDLLPAGRLAERGGVGATAGRGGARSGAGATDSR